VNSPDLELRARELQILFISGSSLFADNWNDLSDIARFAIVEPASPIDGAAAIAFRRQP